MAAFRGCLAAFPGGELFAVLAWRVLPPVVSIYFSQPLRSPLKVFRSLAKKKARKKKKRKAALPKFCIFNAFQMFGKLNGFINCLFLWGVGAEERMKEQAVVLTTGENSWSQRTDTEGRGGFIYSGWSHAPALQMSNNLAGDGVRWDKSQKLGQNAVLLLSNVWPKVRYLMLWDLGALDEK